MDTWWTWPISGCAMLGTWLVGKQLTAVTGWIISLVTQVAWVAYVTSTRQWGLVIPSVITLGVFTRNLVVSWRERAAREVADEVAR